MSADNMICVQKRLDGKWWVWMEFASDEMYSPAERDINFDTPEKANAYAQGWLRGESVVEYGVVILSPEKPEPEISPPTQTQVVCPWCTQKITVSLEHFLEAENQAGLGHLG